jgi:hypothetical protein
MAVSRISRRALLSGVSAIGPAVMLGSHALAEGLNSDDFHTVGLEHIGMVVPDAEEAARFYSSVFNPDIQKEHEPPLRYYVMTGTGYIAIGSSATVADSSTWHRS